MNREVKELIRELQGRGWYVKRKGVHIIMHYIPGGWTTIPVSPSDGRWLENQWRDIKRVEKQYGPYVPEERLKISDRRGSDYSPTDTERVAGMSRNEVINSLFGGNAKVEVIAKDDDSDYEEIVPLVPLPTVEVEPRDKMSEGFVPGLRLRQDLQNMRARGGDSNNSYIQGFSMIDREIIISTLTEKAEALRVKIEPYLSAVEEYQRIMAVLAGMNRAGLPDSEKVKEFVGTNFPRPGGGVVKPLRISNVVSGKIFGEDGSVETVRRPRTDMAALCRDIKEVLLGNGGKLGINELREWLEEVKGYKFGAEGATYKTSPNSDIVTKITAYKKANPGQVPIVFCPERVEGANKAEPCKWVEWRG